METPILTVPEAALVDAVFAACFPDAVLFVPWLLLQAPSDSTIEEANNAARNFFIVLITFLLQFLFELPACITLAEYIQNVNIFLKLMDI